MAALVSASATMTTQKMTEQSARLQFIDGLRGTAVALVVLCHTAIWSGLPHDTVTCRLLFLGRAGVDLFLVLSGFCLFWPLVKGGDGNVKNLQIAPYFARRIRRIFPPYYAALVLVIACFYLAYSLAVPIWRTSPFPWNGAESNRDLLAHIFLLHGFFLNYAHSFDGAFWSLSLEWQFYFLLLPLVWLARKFNLTIALLIPVLISLFFRLAIQATDPTLFKFHVISELSLSRWVEFGAGMGAAVLVSRAPVARPRFFGHGLYALLSVLSAFLLEYFSLVFFLMPFVWANACFALVVYLANEKSRLRAAFEWPPLVRLGTISYSLYLVHGSVFTVMAIFMVRAGISAGARQLIFLGLGPFIATAFAAVFFTLFEKPFLHKIAPGKTERATAPLIETA